MKKTPNIKKIKCAIFHSKNEEIEGLTKAINEAEDIGKKAYFAQRLEEEAEALFNCVHFNEKRVDCKICRYIAKLRIKTANLITKVKQLKTNK